MSYSQGPGLPWDDAFALASEVAVHLEPWCVRSKCVGSVRRRRPECGDIEFVVEPHASVDLLGEKTPLIEPVRAAVQELGDWVKGGDRMMQVTDLMGRYGVKLEVYLVIPPASWGSLVAIRTGPADLGKYVVTRCRERGYVHAKGFAKRGGVRIPTDTEEQFFALADVPCVPPHQRDALADRLWADFNRRSTA